MIVPTTAPQPLVVGGDLTPAERSPVIRCIGDSAAPGAVGPALQGAASTGEAQ